MRLWILFCHEVVSLIWLREMDPYSFIYRQEKKKDPDSYIPKRVKDHDERFCHCGLLKLNVTDEGCMVCMHRQCDEASEAKFCYWKT